MYVNIKYVLPQCENSYNESFHVILNFQKISYSLFKYIYNDVTISTSKDTEIKRYFACETSL